MPWTSQSRARIKNHWVKSHQLLCEGRSLTARIGWSLKPCLTIVAVCLTLAACSKIGSGTSPQSASTGAIVKIGMPTRGACTSSKPALTHNPIQIGATAVPGAGSCPEKILTHNPLSDGNAATTVFLSGSVIKRFIVPRKQRTSQRYCVFTLKGPFGGAYMQFPSSKRICDKYPPGSWFHESLPRGH